MITRIKKVRDYRALRNWSCGEDVADFATINVVYGFNGSGKSTLCSLLRDASADADWATGLELEVTETGTRRSVTSHEDPFWPRVKVFNRDYVEANLQFDEADPTAIPLLVLGEQQVENEARRADLQASLREIDQKLPDVRQKKIKADNGLSMLMKTTANTILTELQHLGGRYAPRSFNAASVRRRLADGFTAPPADTDINTLLGVIRENQLDAVTIPLTSFSIERLVSEVRSALASTAVAQVIDDLREHPDWNRWVQEGLVLHGARDACIYCASAVTAERKEALARHFDGSVRQLQGRIAAIESELHEARDSCARTVATLPADELVSSELRLSFAEARLAVGLRVGRWNEAVAVLLEAVDRKRDSLFSVVELPEVPGPPTVAFDDVIALLQRHNEMVEQFDERRRTAAQQIELAHIAGIRNQADVLSGDSARLESEQRDLSDMRQKLQEELASLTGDELDGAPIAQELNDDLGRLLGRSDLKFSLGQHGYRITRDGRPANHLSEGERNAIALLYFLRSLETHDAELDKSTVVIDDPVSSLDRNALTGLSTHLWRRLVEGQRCRQLILFTHNFEFFRQWLIQLQLAGKKGKDRQIFEMRRRVARDDAGRTSWSLELASWSRDGLLETHLRSEYHYLFWRIANTVRQYREAPSIELDIEADSVLPNASRRLLEGFLGFKVPASLGNLRVQVASVRSASLDDVTRAAVDQYLGRHSHFETADSTVPVDGGEGVHMLLVILQFIYEVDADHFTAMCEAVAVDGGYLRDAFPAAIGGHATSDSQDAREARGGDDQ